jgi:23S rRNA (adenine2503-C2)-methyltransferase
MIGLAVSLHGPDDQTRANLLPHVKAVPIDAVIKALREYPLPKRRRITIEYVTVRGVNDSPKHAAELARRLGPVKCKVNLIPFNEHHATDLRSPAPEAVERFKQVLLSKGVPTTVRRRRGADIGAACGQLTARRKS